MVCDRCVRVVKEELEAAGFTVPDVRLGQADIMEETSGANENLIAEVLKRNGFALLHAKQDRLVEQIKSCVIEHIRGGNVETASQRQSDYLAEKLGMSFAYLSRVFSANETVTLEKYIIMQKIEYAKELVDYGEASLNEIADTLGYKSVSHLSAQFKSHAGITISEYRKAKGKLRRPLDAVVQR